MGAPSYNWKSPEAFSEKNLTLGALKSAFPCILGALKKRLVTRMVPAFIINFLCFYEDKVLRNECGGTIISLSSHPFWGD